MAIDAIRGPLKAVLEYYIQDRDQAQAQLAELQAKVRDRNNTIASLSRELYGQNIPTAPKVSTPKYALISVRWAILDLLSHDMPLSTADIADILQREGVTTKADSFLNSISAVLSSTMKNRDQEVRQLPDGKWELTEKGTNAAFHIRGSAKFLKNCPWAIAPSAASDNGITKGDHPM